MPQNRRNNDRKPASAKPSDFPYHLDIPTRWGDNDQLGHVNNVVYYRYFEAVLVHFLREEGSLDWTNGPVVAMAVESLCRFHRPLSYPEIIDAGMRIKKIGNSSLIYSLALFSQNSDTPAATGHFVHVFVDRQSEKSVAMPVGVRASAERFI